MLLLILVLAGVAQAQTSSTKTYRGSVGDKHVEMRLTVDGNKVTGKYFYDLFKQDIDLEGEYDSKGQLLLTEGKGKRKTGKFVCKRESETPDVDLDCEWSRADGSGKILAFLVEQGVRFKSDIKLVPKRLVDRKKKAEASYPQFSSAVLTPAMTAFNSLVESRVQAAIKDFDPGDSPNAAFDTNYNIMFVDEEKISIELNEYSDAGGAHPNTYFRTLNYNLKTNKEMSLEDVFNPRDEYKTVLAEFVAKDINRRAEEIEKYEARSANRQPERRDEPIMTVDQLPEIDAWAISPRGFVVYFDFPHVMAVFDKTVVPYGVLARYFKPDGVVPLVK